MGSARPTITKRQREQIKKDKRLLKAEKRLKRKNEPAEAVIEEYPSSNQ